MRVCAIFLLIIELLILLTLLISINEKTRNNMMFGLIKKMFIGLLINIVNVSNHTKQVSLSNQKYMTQSTYVYLDPNEYS